MAPFPFKIRGECFSFILVLGGVMHRSKIFVADIIDQCIQAVVNPADPTEKISCVPEAREDGG